MKKFSKDVFIRNLSLAMEHADETANSLAGKIDVGQSGLSKILRGETNPSAETVAKIVGYLGINANWLLFDEGDMHMGMLPIHMEATNLALPMAANIIRQTGDEPDFENNENHRKIFVSVYETIYVQQVGDMSANTDTTTATKNHKKQ